MKLKQFLQNFGNSAYRTHDNPQCASESGFTLVELLVATSIGLIITAMTISVTLSNRGIFDYDLARTQLNQNLRSAMDILGIEIRQGGENLPSTFPAVVITNGSNGAADELQLRRNLIDEVLKLCQPITAGTTSGIYFADSSTTAGCSYSGNTQNYNSWRNYRTSHDGNVPAYIYDPSTQKGEFFSYNNESDTGSSYIVLRGAGSWSNNYTVGNTAAYILEEWHFNLLPDAETGENILQIVENSETDALNVVYGIADFQVTATLNDNTVSNSFAVGSDWSTLKYLTVSLSGTDTSRGRQISKTVTSQFFPRNILSH